MKLNSELNFSNLVAKIFLKPRGKISQTSRHVTKISDNLKTHSVFEKNAEKYNHEISEK